MDRIKKIILKILKMSLEPYVENDQDTNSIATINSQTKINGVTLQKELDNVHL